MSSISQGAGSQTRRQTTSGGVVETYDNVKRLEQVELPDKCPSIEVFNSAISYDLTTAQNSDFEDRQAYSQNAATRFVEETKDLGEMAKLLSTGKKFISLLYTYRSCSKALPMVQQTTPEEQRYQIHNQTFLILRPEIQKMKELLEFHEFAVRQFSMMVQRLVKPTQSEEVQSQMQMDMMIQLMDMLIQLDALKDMKACLLNDFSRYKRAFSSIRGSLEDSDVISEEIHNLQMFLSNPAHHHNLIIWHLKTDIQKISGYADVLIMLLNHCMDTLEEQRYVLASEKHTLYRSVPYLVYLADSDEEKGLNIFKHKNFKINRVQKLFKYTPVIPLYGDMKISIVFILQQCIHWDAATMGSAWQGTNPVKLEKRYILTHLRGKIRAEYNSFTLDYVRVANEIRGTLQSRKPVTPETLRGLFDRILQGYKLLNSWTASIIEQSAWKYQNPCDEKQFIARGGKMDAGAEYEKVVKYNYTNEELYALVDVISMVKGLGGLMGKYEVEHMPLIRQNAHDDLQEFLQKEVARPLRKAFKRKRPVMDVMTAMRDIGGDWLNRQESKEDYKKTKKEILTLNRDFPRRATAPTQTQISLIRRMMRTIFDPKAEGMKGGFFGGEKDLKPEWAEVWTNFYNRSFFYKYLLNYRQTLAESTDMSHLWYREFYLEMTKCVQFPIGMSMPWILTEFIVKTPSMKENIFFPMDIYNDAAQRALTVLGQQFLYDEIEAEVNLAFDQLIFTLSEEIFKYYKSMASSILIDKPLSSAFGRVQGKPGALNFNNSRYDALMAQRHIQLLGRSVDLRMLIAQHINTYLRQNLDYVISKFEASDLTCVVELHSLLSNIKIAHQLLSKHLPIDPFEDMFTEINEDTNVGQFRGRIVMHVFSELISDLIPNFIFNTTTNRFICGPKSYVDKPVRESAPKGVPSYMWYGRGFRSALDGVADLTRGFFGVEHVEALLQVLDAPDVPLVVSECLNQIEFNVSNVLAEYVRVLHEGLQPSKLPSEVMGVMPAYSAFELKLKDLIRYTALRPAVFQCLREMGNTLAFLHLLEGTQHQVNDIGFQHAAFFLGIKATKPRSEVVEEQVILDAFQKPASARFADIIANTGAELSQRQPQSRAYVERVVASARETERLYDSILVNQSIFAGAVQRIDQLVRKSVRTEWLGRPPSNGILDVEASNDFGRLWSGLQFIFCAPSTVTAEGDFPDIDTFGDGFAWAGMAILHVLGIRTKFTLLDWNLHMLKLNVLRPIPREIPAEVVNKLKRKKKLDAQESFQVAMLPVVNAYLRDAQYVKELNEMVSSIYEAYFPSTPASATFIVTPEDDVKGAAPRAISSGVRGGPSNVPSAPTPSRSAAPPAPAKTAPPPAPALSAPPAPPMRTPAPPRAPGPPPAPPARGAPPAPPAPPGRSAPPAPPGRSAPPAPPAPPSRAPAPPAPPSRMPAPPPPPGAGRAPPPPPPGQGARAPPPPPGRGRMPPPPPPPGR